MRGLRPITLSVALLVASAAHGQTSDDSAATFRADFLAGKLSWQQVLDRAKQEARVNFFYWGGNDVLNLWMDSVAGQQMAGLGIALYPNRLTETWDAVDLVIDEHQAGKAIGQGSADVIWLNGENFLALEDKDLLFGAFAEKLPNSGNFDWDPKDPRSNSNRFDFGVATGAHEIPWSSEQYVCAVNRQYVPADKTPTTFAELESYLESNPGRFSYIAPPEKSGTTFVVAALYAHNPDGTGVAAFQRSASAIGVSELARLMAPGLAFLRSLQPHLLHDDNGDVHYLADAIAADRHFRDGDIHFTCAFGTYKTASRITTGRYPDTAEAMIFPKDLMIRTKTFLAIPASAAHPAAALVFANYMASVDAQASKLRVVGYPPGVDLWTLKESNSKAIEAAAPPHVGVTQNELDANAVPDAHATLIDIVAAAWQAHVLEGSTDGLEDTIAAAIGRSAQKPAQ